MTRLSDEEAAVVVAECERVERIGGAKALRELANELRSQARAALTTTALADAFSVFESADALAQLLRGARVHALRNAADEAERRAAELEASDGE